MTLWRGRFHSSDIFYLWREVEAPVKTSKPILPSHFIFNFKWCNIVVNVAGEVIMFSHSFLAVGVMSVDTGKC